MQANPLVSVQSAAGFTNVSARSRSWHVIVPRKDNTGRGQDLQPAVCRGRSDRFERRDPVHEIELRDPGSGQECPRFP